MKDDDVIMIYTAANDFCGWLSNFDGDDWVQEVCFAFVVSNVLAKNLVIF